MNESNGRLAIVPIIVTFFLMANSGIVFAQILPEASHVYYSHDDVEYTIVRSAGKGVNFNMVTCCKIPDEDMSTYSHSFIARDFSLNTAKIIYLPVYTNGYGIMYDQINDMRILGDYCYFCGRRKYMVGYVAVSTSPFEPIVYMPEYDSCGIFGYFEINPLATDASVSLYMDVITQIKTANRMTAFIDGINSNQTRVVLLGVPSNYAAGNTSLVNLVNPAGILSPINAWDYFIENNTSSDEIMTDVVATGSSLVTTSIYISDNQLVGFRYIDLDDACNGYYGTIGGNLTYLYDLRDFDFNRECQVVYLHGYVREVGTGVMLTPAGDGYIAGLCGRECRRDGNGPYPTEYGSALIMAMSTPSIIYEAQLVECGYDAWMKDLSFISGLKQVKALMRSRWRCNHYSDFINALVTMTLDSVKPGDCYYQYIEYKEDCELLSIDALRGTSLSYSGFIFDGKKPFDGNYVPNSAQEYDCILTLQTDGGETVRVDPIEYSLELCHWNNDYFSPLIVPEIILPVETIESVDCPDNNQ